MEMIRIKISGTRPLIMHSDRAMMHLFDEQAREFKALTGKRKKTDEDQHQISRLEWELGMYFDAKIGPYIPSVNLEGCLRDGAKHKKRGEDVKRGIHVMEDKIQLEYAGPRDLDGLWSKGFRDLRTVGNQNNKVLRCRPIFPDWAAKFTVAFDPSIFNKSDVIQCLQLAGAYNGLCDYTPRYGRFEVEAS